MVWELVNDLFLVSMSGLLPASILRLQRPPRDSLASSFRLGAQIGDSNRINHLRALWGKNRGEGRSWVAYTGEADSGMLPELMICLRRRTPIRVHDVRMRPSAAIEAGADELVSAVVDDDDDDAGRPLRERDSE